MLCKVVYLYSFIYRVQIPRDITWPGPMQDGKISFFFFFFYKNIAFFTIRQRVSINHDHPSKIKDRAIWRNMQKCTRFQLAQGMQHNITSKYIFHTLT